jgi:hypothetical protein
MNPLDFYKEWNATSNILRSEDCSDNNCRNEAHITEKGFISCRKLLSAYYTSAQSDKANTHIKQQTDTNLKYKYIR